MDYTLSTSNIEFIKKELAGSGLTYSHLMDELIDHVCCDIEHEMHNGLPFAKAYEVVKTKIGIEGLERIQHETLYLIDKNYRIMKNTMKISGLAAPILLSFGSLFKIQHWQGAGVLLVIGFFLLSFVFLPSAIYVSYKEVSNFTKKWTHLVGFAGTFFISIGFLFKVQHWPYAGAAITIGILETCLVFLPMVLRNRLNDQKDLVPKLVYIIAFTGFIINLAGLLIKMMQWPYSAGFLITGCILLVLVAFPLYIYYTFKDNLHIANSFVFIVIVLAWFIIPTTLVSLNLSRNVMNHVHALNQSMGNDLEFLQEMNRIAVNDMKDNPSANQVNDQTRNLMLQIEKMKVRSQNNEMPDSLEMKKLTSLVGDFEDQLISLVKDDKYKTIISRTLGEPFSSKSQPSRDRDLFLHQLLFLQMNIGLAEQTALKQLHITENQSVQALNQ